MIDFCQLKTLCSCNGNVAVTMDPLSSIQGSCRFRPLGSPPRNSNNNNNNNNDDTGENLNWRKQHPHVRMMLPLWLVAMLLMLPTGLAIHPEAMALINSNAAAASNYVDYEASRDALKREQGICSSLDIRNTIASLSQLENCTVVEGFVMIVLIEEDKETGRGFLNHSYPKLREISGYLLLYRVYGLGSLKDLFPNLSVIRGQQLFFDFALVVYELMALKELGLQSLTDIQRGSVLLEKNPNLCYVETIQWDLITKTGEHNFINSNKKPSECRACPDHCPPSPSGDRLCWTNDHCQKVCNDCKGLPCNITAIRSEENRVRYSSFCCHEECAGGCSGPGSKRCDVCKHVSHNNDCLPMCPTSSYLYLDRRCLTEQECMAMPPPRESNDKYGRWKPIGGQSENPECSMECPPGHEEIQKTLYNGNPYYTCQKCNGACPKVCLGALINNIETAQQLKGCSAIQGNLEMQIKGGSNIIQELENNLGDIEEIHGMLKIVRSFPLVSLNFFKRLRVIHGNHNEADGPNSYALVIQENPNLQQLFVEDGRELRILDKMMFHFNPKLCYDLIIELHNKSRSDDTSGHRRNILDTDVSPWSNGDKATCNEQVLDVKIDEKTDKVMLISWDKKFKQSLADKRHLLGYVISHIEAPHENVTYYDGRDACGGDGWTINDVEGESNIITQLKPYTQYAIYVQTYTVAPLYTGNSTGKRVGARSRIIYERTDPAEPSQPQNLKAYAMPDSELTISWHPPEYPNGIVTTYIVSGSLREEDRKYYDNQDSCAVSNENQVKKTLVKPNTSINNQTNPFKSIHSQDCCECSAKNGPIRRGPEDKKEKERKFKIEFENYLHNKVYVKQVNIASSSSSERSKRSTNRSNVAGDNAGTGDRIPDEFPDSESSSNSQALGPAAVFPSLVNRDGLPETNTDNEIKNKTPRPDFKDGKLVTFYETKRVNENSSLSDLTVTVKPVMHYSEYTIEVTACHDRYYDAKKNKTMPKLCSKTAVTSVRSKEDEKADNISSQNITIGEYNFTTSSIKVSWKEPENPNGLIIKYVLDYQRTDITNPKVTRECVRHKDFLEANRTKTLVDLSPGEYSIQISAQSLAKLGNPSDKKFFTIREPDRAMDWRIIVGIVMVVVIPIFFVTIGGYCFIKKKRHIQTITSINPDYHKYEVDGWEVARENVVLIRELGQGSFGMVYEGIVRNVVYQKPEAKCAVKTVNDKASVAERIQFLNEASVMKEFNSHHVVKLLGVVSKAQPTLVIMELMASGDLKTYLRSHRPDCEENVIEGRQPPTLKCILKMAIEIADGMSYLSDKKFVHRDLAARNCMVAEDLTVKIGDFGMTRDIYETDYYRKGGKGLLPVRWMAPESLRDGVFTSQCDVWSFGVVLWEMATLASQPYQGLSSEQVLKYVMDGGVMERPEGCPDCLYNLMKTCWYYQAKHRPTFLDIIADLLPDVPVQFASVSFYHSDTGVIARAAQKAYHEQETRKLNDSSTPLRSSMDLVDDDMYSSRESLHKQLHPNYSRDQAFQIDDDVPPFNTSSDCFEMDNQNPNPNQNQQPQDAKEGIMEKQQDKEDDEENESEDEENANRLRDADADDHVTVLIPKDQRVYVLVKNPTGHGTSNGSKNDSSKGTTVSSEDSKGSYVSNGSAPNGYVMGILKQRRQNNTEC